MTPAVYPTGTTDVFVALLDALQHPQRYVLFEHDGELFVVPTDRGGSPAPISLAGAQRRKIQELRTAVPDSENHAVSMSLLKTRRSRQKLLEVAPDHAQ